MRGHITKRYKTGGWYVKVSLGKDQTTGKYKYHTFTVKGSRADAEKRLTEVLRQIDTGTFIQPDKITTKEYLTLWLDDYARINLSPRGFERYSSIVTNHLIPAFGNIPLLKLKPEHLQKHYSDLIDSGRSIGTARYHHAVLHKALQTALQWQIINRNVSDAINPGRIRRDEMLTWDEIELNKFLETAKNSQYYALFYAALFTGMRRSELLALRWQDIDFVFNQIYINRSLHQLKDNSFVFTQPKSTKSRRMIAMPASLSLTLQDHLTKKEFESKMCNTTFDDTDLVFSTYDMKPLRPNTITRAWHDTAIKAGVPVIRLHDARHTHATLMLKQGIHPKIVQERLGHSTIAMTLDTYSHVSPGLQQAAAESFDRMVSSELVANGKIKPSTSDDLASK